MSYTTTPMENFNRKNPFIILLKKRYDAVNDLLQDTASILIKNIIFSIISLFIYSIFCINSIIIFNSFIMIIPLIIYIAIIIPMVLTYINRIQFYMKKHPSMIEFDKLSNLQMNEILILNNEDIMNCLYNMNIMYGEMKMEFQYKKCIIIITDIICVISAIVLFVSICYF